MAKSAATFVNVTNTGEGKLLLTALITPKQLEAVGAMFEEESRTWRGQYQSLAKAIVDACT